MRCPESYNLVDIEQSKWKEAHTVDVALRIRDCAHMVQLGPCAASAAPPTVADQSLRNPAVNPEC
jgi:hypothetical protein